MDSQSSETEIGVLDLHLRFNSEQTTKVVECVTQVLKLIASGAKNTIGKKTITKENRMPQVKKNQLANVNELIVNVCDMLGDVESKRVQPVAELPRSSRHGDAESNAGGNYKSTPEINSKKSVENSVSQTSENMTKPREVAVTSENNIETEVTGSPASNSNAGPKSLDKVSKKVDTEHSKNIEKRLRDSKTYHVTEGSSIQETTGIPETPEKASTETTKHVIETEIPKSSLKTTGTEVSQNTASRSDVVKVANLKHIETITDATSSTNIKVGNFRSDSITNGNSTSEKGNHTLVTSPRQANNVLCTGNNNLQIFAEPIMITTEGDVISNNNDVTRKTNVDLKRSNNVSNTYEPKRAKIACKCSLCGKTIDTVDLDRHYKEQHGIHHEIKHNNKNYKHKIQDLSKRLDEPMDKNKTTNEERDKVKAESVNRSADKSISDPTESSNAVIENRDELEESADKKRRTETWPDSAPNEHIPPPAGITKSETAQNIFLNLRVIDLTDDNDDSKVLENVKVSNPTAIDDEQKLSDQRLGHVNDDTSLYELPEIKTENAEAILLENVKEEAVNYELDSNVEVINNIPTLSIKNEPYDKINQQSTKQTNQKQNDCKAVVSESAITGVDTVAECKINFTGEFKLPGASAPTDIKHTEPRITNNPTSVVSKTRIEVSIANAETRTKLETRTRNETIELNSKGPAGTPYQNLTLTQKITQQNSSEKGNDKHARKLPYEKRNKTLSNAKKQASRKQASEKQNDCKAVVSESAITGVDTVAECPINITGEFKPPGKIPEASAPTDIKYTEPRITNNPTSVVSKTRIEVSIANAETRTKRETRTHYETIDLNSKPAVTPYQNLTLTQKIAQQDSSEKRNDKHARKLPYKKPNKTLSNASNVSSGTAAYNTSRNKPKAPTLILKSISKLIQKSNQANSVKTSEVSMKNIHSEIASILQGKPKPLTTITYPTTNTSKQLIGSTKQPNSRPKNTYETINAPSNCTPNSTITPTRNVNQTSRKRTNSKTPQLNISLHPTTDTKASPGVTSKLTKSQLDTLSVLQKMSSIISTFSSGLPNNDLKLNSLSSNAFISSTNTAPVLSIINHQTSKPDRKKSSHRQSPTSIIRDILQKNEIFSTSINDPSSSKQTTQNNTTPQRNLQNTSSAPQNNMFRKFGAQSNPKETHTSQTDLTSVPYLPHSQNIRDTNSFKIPNSQISDLNEPSRKFAYKPVEPEKRETASNRTSIHLSNPENSRQSSRTLNQRPANDQKPVNNQRQINKTGSGNSKLLSRNPKAEHKPTWHKPMPGPQK